MAASSSLRAYASPRESWWYDVFLSFRGEDTRNNFTSFLFAALKNNGFHPFHDTLLPRGHEIAAKLLEAIEQSQISIVVFSKNYADSRWCLDELVKINDCRRSHPAGRHKVLPLFLDVEPSDVRKQEGCYKQAFLDHCRPGSKFNKERTDRWREALFETGNLSGPHLQNHANGDEEEFVRQIVKEVAFILNRPHLHVANHPVGIEPCVRDVCSLLDNDAAGSDGVGSVVIWGIGGIGKTTIAKATFNLLAPRFEGCSFLADVRSTCGQVDGAVKLQKQLISDLRNEKNTRDVDIHNYHQGTQQIKNNIGNRPVLLVVDDVDSSEQLEMLAINRKNLHSGSRVLVTTRHSSPTVISGQVSVYEPRGLNKEDSIQLFTTCVDGNEDPGTAFLEEVNKLAGGLPLVLEVWAAYFRSFKVEHWHLALSKLRKVPHANVQAKLRISYDSLDDKQKRLFLDIACFFIGMKKEFVIRVLKDEAFGWFPELEIEKLHNQYLVYLDHRTSKLLMMHDVIRDMGREIVRQESPEDPEKRTRLWDRHDVLRILKYNCSGSGAIESIILDNNLSNSDGVSVSAEAFRNLQNLRLLNFRNVQISGTYNDQISFTKLKCLQWDGFPLKCLPINWNMSNLVALELNNSKLEQLWEGTKEMNELRFLDVGHSTNLIKTPNFSQTRSLEVLKLHDCTNLEVVDESILCLNKLVFLDLSNCEKLRTFPLQSRYLEKPHFSGCMTELDISYCNLSHVAPEIGSLESLRVLRLNGNRFSSLPDSVSNLQGLEGIFLDSCVNLHSIPDLPRKLGYMSAEGCISLTNLPPSMSDSQSLTFLWLNDCVALKSIPYLPSSMAAIRAHGCLSLETIPLAPLAAPWATMEFSNCPILEQDECKALRRFLSDSYVRHYTLRSIPSNSTRGSQLHFNGELAAGAIPKLDLQLSGTEIPSWFNYQSAGKWIRFVAQCKVQGWIFCVINSPHQRRNGSFEISAHVVNLSRQENHVRMWDNSYEISSQIKVETSGTKNVRMWVHCEPFPRRKIQVNRGDDVQIRFKIVCFGGIENIEVEKCGVYLIYEDEEIDDHKVTEGMHEVIDSQYEWEGKGRERKRRRKEMETGKRKKKKRKGFKFFHSICS